jgi:hypothetical protein
VLHAGETRAKLEAAEAAGALDAAGASKLRAIRSFDPTTH